MKKTNCYNCASEFSTLYAEENGYSLVKCDDCGLLYVSNRPSDGEISQAHKQGVHSGVNSFNITGRYAPGRITNYESILSELFKDGYSHIKTWLDVGCGYGEFMEAIQNFSGHKITVKGTEPNTIKKESAKKRGLDVDYFDLDLHNEKYDAISLLNVYSHLPDPPAFLSSVKKLLNLGGELIIETGDTADLPAKHQLRPYYLPDHLSFASEKIVVGILERLNFKVLSTIKYPAISFNVMTLAKELAKTILPRYKSRLKSFLRPEFYSYKTDMYIRAKLIS